MILELADIRIHPGQQAAAVCGNALHAGADRCFHQALANLGCSPYWICGSSYELNSNHGSMRFQMRLKYSRRCQSSLSAA